VKKILTLAVGATLASTAFAALDFGQKVEQVVKAQSLTLFGLSARSMTPPP